MTPSRFSLLCGWFTIISLLQARWVTNSTRCYNCHTKLHKGHLLIDGPWQTPQWWKNEFLIIGTRQQRSKVNISLITLVNSDVMRSSVVGNLGSYIDDKLSMNFHINKICCESFYYLHNIRWIRKCNSTETFNSCVSVKRIGLL